MDTVQAPPAAHIRELSSYLMSRKPRRIQSSLTQAESDLVEQVAALTRTRPTDVIKNALAVYAWFVRQTMTGARVTARTPSGEEVTLETPELTALGARAAKLSPEALAALGKGLAGADPVEAARLRERLTRGFYGI